METRKAAQQLSSGKATGADAIPQEYKDASIIHLYKRKENPQVCDGDSLNPFCGNEWGQTGLCYGTNTVQHDAFCHAHDSDIGFPIRYHLMAVYLTLGDCKPKLRCRLMC